MTREALARPLGALLLRSARFPALDRVTVAGLHLVVRIVGGCPIVGPRPFPGALPYLCTADRGHLGAHVATDPAGRVVDTWPQVVSAGQSPPAAA